MAQIEELKNKEDRSAKDDAKLKALEKELEPIVKFLDDAKKQRDAILVEIGMHYLFVFCFDFFIHFFLLLIVSQFTTRLYQMCNYSRLYEMGSCCQW